MKEKEIKNRIDKLHTEIARLRYDYHVTNKPNVTDDVYESLTRELQLLLKKNPEFILDDNSLDRVAGRPLDNFKKVNHTERMLSLNDTFSFDEVLEWENKIKKLTDKKFTYFAELKLDGLAVSLIYQNGIFIRGATRGDGYVGEDITENLKMVTTIPLRLSGDYPDYIEVRGEVIMPKKVLLILNKVQDKLGRPPFANTRNAAAGSLRQLDPAIVKDRHLSFFAWDTILPDDTLEKNNIYNHSHKHDYLRSLGFTLTSYEKKSPNLKNIFDFIDSVGHERDRLPYGTDGIVITVDELSVQKQIGIVGKAPRYSSAYKYAAERATTIVTDITLHVGRTGVLTPLGHFVPVSVAGSTVSKATLHNMDQINRLDIRVGDTVVIQKAGDVIPAIVEVLKNLRKGNEKKFTMPSNCPVCNSVVEKRQSQKEKSVAYFCTNKDCSARNARAIQHFVKVYEIDEVGPKILDRLKDEGLINDASDLFLLKESDLSELERFGDKSAKNIIDSINSHKKVLLWRFIYALGIIHVGEQTAKDLARHFKSLEKIINSKIDEVESIANIGPVVCKSIVSYFTKKENIIFIDRLLANGVKIEKIVVDKKVLRFNNQTFVITGSFDTLSRDDIIVLIEKNGGKVGSSVSVKTSFLILGDKPGSKYDNAIKLGVKILREEDFLALLG